MTARQPLYVIADAITGQPWKIGCAWSFGPSQDRLARARTYRPDRTWHLVRVEPSIRRDQLGL